MSIPANINPFLLAAAAVASPVQIERSLRFNSSDSAYLGPRTPASAGNRRTFTFNCWVKRAGLGGDQQLIFAAPSSTDTSHIRFDDDNTLHVFEYTTVFTWQVKTAQVFRDTSSWYHILVAVDTTQATPSNRVKIYVNGAEVTAFSTSSYPTQNTYTEFNNTVAHAIGRNNAGASNYLSAYLADLHWIDGQALTPSSFTEVSATTGQLIPKAYTGTFTGNSFWLKFSDNSSTTSGSNVGIGKDFSGLGNYWNSTNFSVITGNGNYSSSGSYSYTGTQLGSLSNAYDGNSGTSGGSTSGVTFWGIADGTATHSGFSKSFTSGVRIFYNVNTSGGSISVNGSSKSASVPPGGNTTVGVLDWTGSISSPFTSISITSPNGGVGVYVSGIEIDGILLINYTAGAGNDSLVDTPTSYGTDTGVGGEVRGNYATLNPLLPTLTPTNGNLDTPNSAGQNYSTIAVSTGKWYAETTVGPITAGTACGLGLHFNPTADSGAGFYNSGAYIALLYENNLARYEGINSTVNFYPTAGAGSILAFRLDLDSGTQTISYYVNNVLITSSNLPAGKTWFVTTRQNNNQSLNFGQRPFAYTAPSGFKSLCDTNLTSATITTSGSYTGNGVADGPFVYLNGVPTAMTIGGNAVTFGTHADKLANGFKIRTSSTTYNQNALSYNYSITSTGAAFKNARAQPNP